MDINRFINFIVQILVAIGDAVIFLAVLPFRVIQKTIRKLIDLQTSRKNYLKGEFRISKKRKIRIPLVSSLFSLSFSILIFILKILRFIAFFPVFLIRAVFDGRKQARERREIEARKYAKVRLGHYRPSFWYKLKYILVGFIFSGMFIFTPLASFIFISDLPNLSDLSVNSIPKTTKIYDRNGTLLYEIYANQNRTVAKLSNVPKTLINATVAIEDKDFYTHPGFDLRGMIRAFIVNVREKGFQGGSTITQQLIKSAYLTPDPTIVRKIKEITLAFWAERQYTKDQILELYLNYVPYGGTAWGAQSAANVYFGKNVADLDLAESAFLAGLPQSPSTYSPLLSNNTLWKKRQLEVLNAMQKQGYITNVEKEQAASEKLNFAEQRVPLKAPHFVFYVRNLLIQRYGISEVERGGLTVKTTLDLPTQDAAQQIVSDEVDNDAALNIGNGAALITTPENGDILAMIGSRNYYDEEHDGNVNLTLAQRQPGSSIKLITYALALENGYTEATILDDSPLTIPGQNGAPSYTPVNYDGAFRGRIPLRTAFGNSFNIPPVRLAQKFGPDAVKNFGIKMGIDSWRGITDYGVAITLGGVETRMTELATAYGTVSNLGKKVDLDPILEIKDSGGNVIYKKNPIGAQVLNPGVAYILSDILADANARKIEFGLDTPLRINGSKVSVKTGTTDNKRDNWTVGFTSKFLVATWVGNNDNTPMNPALASGITGAAPMWNKLIYMMLDRTGTPSALMMPDNVVKKYCAGQERYFVRGTEKAANCSYSPISVTPSPTP